MTLSVPPEKLRKIRQDARRLLDQNTMSIREIAQFVGKTTATLRAIPLSGSPRHDEFRSTPELLAGGDNQEIQHVSDTEPSQQRGPQLVGTPSSRWEHLCAPYSQ